MSSDNTMPSLYESLAMMVDIMEREAFEAWYSEETERQTFCGPARELTWHAWQARAAMNSMCRGVAHPGCNYLAPCGSICDKCGTKT